MKRGKLSKEEITEIETSELSTEELSRKLSRSTMVIQKHKDINKIKAGDLLAKRPGIVIMTKEASAVSDVTPTNNPFVSDKYKDCLHKMKE